MHACMTKEKLDVLLGKPQRHAWHAFMLGVGPVRWSRFEMLDARRSNHTNETGPDYRLDTLDTLG